MGNLPISGIEVFLAVAKYGSLKRASEALGVRSPAVSYQLKTLEEKLGTALFLRTTRSVRLTDAGRLLLTRAQPAVTQLEEALEEARASSHVRKRAIKITLPYFAYELTIAKKLSAFQEAYPEIELELSFNEGFEDIVTEGFHAGVRSGGHIREDMIAVRLTPPLKQVFFASPAYLDKHGRPECPEELLKHNCIRYRYIASKRIAEWEFDGPEGSTTVDVKGRLIVNSTSALVSAVRDGLGIGWLFRPNIEDDLAAGRLESILDDYAIQESGHFLYYPRANGKIEVLRVFIDFMKFRT